MKAVTTDSASVGAGSTRPAAAAANASSSSRYASTAGAGNRSSSTSPQPVLRLATTSVGKSIRHATGSRTWPSVPLMRSSWLRSARIELSIVPTTPFSYSTSPKTRETVP